MGSSRNALFVRDTRLRNRVCDNQPTNRLTWSKKVSTPRLNANPDRDLILFDNLHFIGYYEIVLGSGFPVLFFHKKRVYSLVCVLLSMWLLF